MAELRGVAGQFGMCLETSLVLAVGTGFACESEQICLSETGLFHRIDYEIETFNTAAETESRNQWR
jgi:hypothetical protein